MQHLTSQRFLETTLRVVAMLSEKGTPRWHEGKCPSQACKG